MPLFTQKELEDYLQRRAAAAPGDPDDPDQQVEVDPSSGIDPATYSVVERVVSGWLLDATGYPAWPADWSDGKVPPALFAWAIELGAIAHENPASATSDQVDRQSTSWSEQRRTAILARAAAWAAKTRADPTGGPAPTGSFPPAPTPLRW